MATKADYEAQARAAVDEFATKLGLHGAWVIDFQFGRGDRDCELEDAYAAVHVDPLHAKATVKFEEILRPALYRRDAAHECLHVFFSPLERAIAKLEEPARTLLDDFIHAAIDRLATVLTGMALPTHAECEGASPPWAESPPESSPQ